MPEEPSEGRDDIRFTIEGGNRELYDVGEMFREATSRQLTMKRGEFDAEEASSDGRKARLELLAQDLDRVAVQLEAVNLDTIESRVRDIALTELRAAADIFRVTADTEGEMDTRGYFGGLVRARSQHEEAQIILDALKYAHGGRIPGSGWYLNDKGEFGFSDDDRFRVEPMVENLTQALETLGRLPSQSEGGSKENDTQLREAGNSIRLALETIMKTMDMTQGDPMESIFRLVSGKLEATLRLLEEALKDPGAFFSPLTWKVRQDEAGGAYLLERHRRPKSVYSVSPFSELQDAVALLRFSKQVADSKRK